MAITRLGSNSIVTVPSSAITALPAGVGGKVLQVVSSNFDSDESTSNTTWTGTSKRLSITPSSTSSKILIFYSGAAKNSNNTNHAEYTLYRETTSTNLGTTADGMNNVYDNSGVGYYTLSMSYLDSPATSSSVEYRVYMQSNASGTTVTLGRDQVRSVLTLMEIAG